MHGTSALSFVGNQRTPPFQKWMQLLLNVYDCLTVTEFSGSQISCYIWQRINASQNIFHSLPPILNLFQNLSTPIARNSHYFYSEPMLWSISYASLYHIAVFISCQWFLPNPNVYIVEMRLSSGLIFLNVVEDFNFFSFPWSLYLFIPFQDHIFWNASTTSVKVLPELLDKYDFWSPLALFLLSQPWITSAFPWICYPADSQSSCDLQVHPDPCHIISMLSSQTLPEVLISS